MGTVPFPSPASARGSDQESHPIWSGIPELEADLARVRETVLAEAASAGGAMGDALGRYVTRPGKMLRPGFVLIGAWAGQQKAGSSASERTVQIAAAIETLHLATLVHDDVIDDADRRRGEPSLHALHGRKQAVLMGDYLLSRCFSMIGEGTSRENALRIATATGHLVRSEINQMYHPGDERLSRRAYLRRIAGKTAMLFGLSLVTGATENKARSREVVLLGRIGYDVGMSFQIIDDILDFTAHSDALGKPVASDLRSGIYTLPVIEAIAQDPQIRALVVPPPVGAPALEAAVAAVGRAEGIARARARAGAYTARAHREIAKLSDGRQREALTLVTDRLLGREY